MRCQQCGHEFEALPGEPCPRCGHSSPLTPSSPPGGTSYVPPSAPEQHAGAPPPPPPEPPRAGIPWERERSLGSLLQTFQGVLIQPTRTFQEADPAAGIGWALGFAMLLGMIGGTFSAAWDFLMRMAGVVSTDYLEYMPPEFEGLVPFLESPMASLLNLVFLPVYILVGLFLGAAIIHLLLLLFGGAHRGFEATFRVVAFASGATALFQAVPLCGAFVGLVWAVVVEILGIREIHGTTGGKAAAAVLLPFVLCCLCIGIAAALFTAAIVSLAGHG